MYYYSSSDRKLVGENGDENMGTLEDRLRVKLEGCREADHSEPCKSQSKDLDLTLSDKQNY